MKIWTRRAAPFRLGGDRAHPRRILERTGEMSEEYGYTYDDEAWGEDGFTSREQALAQAKDDADDGQGGAYTYRIVPLDIRRYMPSMGEHFAEALADNFYADFDSASDEVMDGWYRAEPERKLELDEALQRVFLDFLEQHSILTGSRTWEDIRYHEGFDLEGEAY
jgi:hypothetical protein